MHHAVNEPHSYARKWKPVTKPQSQPVQPQKESHIPIPSKMAVKDAKDFVGGFKFYFNGIGYTQRY